MNFSKSFDDIMTGVKELAEVNEYVFNELKKEYDSLLEEFKKCTQTLENKNHAEQIKNVIKTMPDNPQRPQPIAPRYNINAPLRF